MICFFILGIFMILAAITCYMRPKQRGIFAKMADVCCRLISSDLRREEVIKRVEAVLAVLFVGNAAALLLWVCDKGVGAVSAEGYIERNEPGGGSRKVLLQAKKEDGDVVKTSLTVQEKEYPQEELERLYEALLEEISVSALGNNPSWDAVSENLSLVKSVEGYPFLLFWESDNYALVTGSGKVAGKEELQETEPPYPPVTIYMRASCGDFERETSFYVQLCPKEEQTDFEELLKRELEAAEKEGGEVVALPDRIGGERLTWSGRRGNESGIMLGVSVCAGVCIFVAQGKEEEKKRRTKQLKMEDAYPSVISRMTLYLGAGMSLKNAWRKIAWEKAEDNPVYREMQLTCREMEGGLGEADAYEQFGRRVKGAHYLRLTTLLVQNLKKGNAALLAQLHNEAFLAMEDRASRVRKKGEEAGTKLLFPMLLVMGMVMVLIMVPAFLSF